MKRTRRTHAPPYISMLVIYPKRRAIFGRKMFLNQGLSLRVRSQLLDDPIYRIHIGSVYTFGCLELLRDVL